MKLTYDFAKRIKEDFNNLEGSEIEFNGFKKTIKEIAILPYINDDFGSFPFNYVHSKNKEDFLLPYLDKEMSLIIIFDNNDFYPFFQFIYDNKITLNLEKYKE